MPVACSLSDQFKFTHGKRSIGGIANFHHAFAQALLLEFQRTVMTIRIVAGLAQQGMRSPCAAGAADIRVIAGAAESPQALYRAHAPKMDFRACLPDLLHTQIADVSPGKPHRRK